MKVLKGKSEILILLKKVLEKFENEKGIVISKNSNRKNYEPIARLLSEISNQLPYTSEELKHEKYPIDYNPRKQEYPFRKYDVGPINSATHFTPYHRTHLAACSVSPPGAKATGRRWAPWSMVARRGWPSTKA